MKHSKRARSDVEPKILEPVLIKTDTKDCIRIDKNEVKRNIVNNQKNSICAINVYNKSYIF